MVCRQFGLSSAVIGQVRTTSWLDDAQIQSVYHTALHDPMLFGGDTQRWSREQLIEQVTTWARRDATFNPVYRPQRREGLRRRIEEGYAPAVAQMPTERLSALARLRTAVTAAEGATRARLQQIAGVRGMSEREVTREFHQLRAEAPAGRQPRATPEQQADFGMMPLDPATRHAITELQSRPPLRAPMPRVDRWIPVRQGEPPVSNPIVEFGSSETDTRIEVRYQDGTTAIRETPQPISMSPGTHQYTQQEAQRVLSNPEVEPGRQVAWRLRCDDCGRFVPRGGHQCVQAYRIDSPRVHVVDADVQVFMASASMMLHEADIHSEQVVLAPVQVTGARGGLVSGEVHVYINGAAVAGDGQQYRVDIDDNGDDLTCQECGSVCCQHVRQARALIRRELRLTGRMPTREQANARLTNPATVTVTERPSAEVAPPAPAPAATVSFGDSPQAFREAARSGNADGVELLPAGTFRGYAEGVTFGIELEYSGGRESTASVGPSLHEAGLIENPWQAGYHSGGRGHQRQTRWRFEADSTVTGELITPVLEDTPQAWDDLSAACSILQENGATTHGTGSHTNIGGIDWAPGDLWRLAHLVRAHEEDLMRFGRTRGSDREWRTWASPIRPIAEAEWTRGHQASVGRGMLNFAHAFSFPGTRRVEFRFPDGSHDAGAIQAQTRLCAAMVGYSRTDQTPIGRHAPVGTARSLGREYTMRLSADDFADQTAPVRNLIDTLFTTDEERLQIAQLWGRGSYLR